LGEKYMTTNISDICQTPDEVEPLLEAIRRRFSQLSEGDCQRRVFLNRLRTMGWFDAEPNDYQEPDAAILPKELEIGFAVCHPECGNQAFVVIEGGPQGCDRCGGTMLPVKTGNYRLRK
jgi:hypothetical protein